MKEPSSAVFLPTSSHVPMPDLTSQPLDPNEPLYCLCHQVSFGEMIGCDNDNVSGDSLLSLTPCNSLEGAMELKFASFCSS